MPNDEKQSSASPKPRFYNKKRRRSFAPPKGVTPTVTAPAAESPQETAAESQGAPDKGGRSGRNRNNRRGKKPYWKDKNKQNTQETPPEAAEAESVEVQQEPEGEVVISQPACPGCGEGGCGESCPMQSEPAPVDEGPKVTIIGVRFKEAGKIYYFDPGATELEKGQSVIVETARGIECGKVAIPNRQVSEASLNSPLKKLVRIATAQDLAKVEQLRKMEAQAKEIWEQKLRSHKLEMTLVDVEYTFDAQKLIFYFTAEGRVDFREFVKDLATVFKTRIELRQIGVRDEAKQIGGLGVCGRPFCCKTFLDDFQQVSIKMAKEQNLSLNSVKISGTCGRLMCCLRYENDVYEQESKKTPGVDCAVMTPDGRGVVVENDVLKGVCKVRLDKKPDLAPAQYHRDDLKVLGKVRRQQNDKNEVNTAEEEKND